MPKYATTGIRLAALFGDLICIQILSLPAFVVLQQFEIALDYWSLTMICWFFYSIIMNASSKRGTIAKRMLKLQVQTDQGERLSIGRSILRTLFANMVLNIINPIDPRIFLISFLITCACILLMLFNRKKKGLHDLVARTIVTYK